MSPSRDVRIDPFLHGKEKFKKVDREELEDDKPSSDSTTDSRIDIIGQNGNTGEHYDDEGC